MTGITPTVPSLYIQNEGENLSTKVALSLTRANDRYVIRLTGGCGKMSAEDAQGLYSLFTGAFSSDFRGALLFGGTRILRRSVGEAIVPGVTEVAPLIRKNCPESVVLGIVPRTEDLKVSQHGMIVCDEDDTDYFTIIHPDQDFCVIIQHSVDAGVVWDAEYIFSGQVVDHLVQFGGWKQLLIAYNGGEVTEREIIFWAEKGWPVLLIDGSGRATERLAKDENFLKKYPNVQVVWKHATEIRSRLCELGALPPGTPRFAVVG